MNNSIKVGPLVFLLQMENITKRPVYRIICRYLFNAVMVVHCYEHDKPHKSIYFNSLSR
jgi:hypothetical protein